MRIIAGKHKNRLLDTPKGLSTRPTMGKVREALFNICQHRIEEARFLDLFAGSGAMGLEALSRGAAQAVFIDMSKESIRCIGDNVSKLGVGESAQIIFGDVFAKLKLLEKMGKTFDIIYVDPPYGEGNKDFDLCERVLRVIDEGSLLRPGGLLFLEGPHTLDLHLKGLKSLTLEKSRQMGRATLQQYSKKEAE